MIVTIHQPEHLPWLGFFDKMLSADAFVCLDTVQYRKNYFQNRNRILTRHGPAWVTVPVNTKGHTACTLKEMTIAQDGRWARRYWQTIAQSYSRHPYFDRYAGRFEEILARPWTHLSALNLALIRALLAGLGMEREIILASELAVSGKATSLLLDICRKLGATVYLSGPSGSDYLDEAPFREAGIEVRYHHFEHPIYPQHGRAEFCPRLSTFDLLMNLGPEGAKVLPALRGAGPLG